MQQAITAIICLILLVFFLQLIKSLTKSYTPKNNPFIIINAKNIETIEYTIRRAIKKYPQYTIYVFNRSKSAEMKLLLENINKNFSEIHIINKF